MFVIMNLNSYRLCRLCLKSSDDLVNIYDNFQGSTIASVLTQHFWFQVSKNDGFPECVCEICWIQTKTFHNFYKRVQWLHKDYTGNLYGADTVPFSDLIKQERTDSPGGTGLEPDLSIVKYEMTESPAEMNDLLIGKEATCDFNEDYGSEQSNMQISYQNYYGNDSESEEREKNKSGENNVTENGIPPPDIECMRSNQEDDLDDNQQGLNLSINKSKKDQQNAQIREFCDMRCEICQDPILQFQTIREAKEHYQKVHKVGGYVVCCGKRYHRRNRLLDHIRTHTDPDAYRCEPCNKQFRDGVALKHHKKIVHTTNTSEHKCKECEKTFKTPMSLAQHERLKHGPESEKKNLQCHKCEKKFSAEESLKNHIRFVHESKSRICDICAQVLKGKVGLRNHMKLLHPTTTPEKVQCNICNAWLTHKVGLRKHMERHQDNAVTCPICEKVVKSKYSLHSHMKWIHHDEKPHQCTMCDKAFKSRNFLKEHIATHTGEDLYSCEYCDKKFKSKANKYKHRRTVHSAELRQESATKISTDTD